MAILYVDGDNGNDSNSGDSEALAKKTISAAVSAATSGSTIYVRNNGSTVYSESVAWTQKNMVFVGYGCTVGDNVRFVLDATGYAYGMSQETTGGGVINLVLENCELRGATSHGVYQRGVGGSASRQSMFNCHIHGNGGDGYRALAAAVINITHCRFSSNGGSGINSNGVNVVAANSIIDNNAEHGIYANNTNASVVDNCFIYNNGLTNITGGSVVSNSVVDSAGGNGWTTGPAQSSSLVNSIVSNSGGYGVEVAAGRSYIVNSAFYSNTSGDVNGTVNYDDRVSGLDPLYVDAENGNYALQPTSPLLRRAGKIGLIDSDIVTYPDLGAIQNMAAGGLFRRVPRFIGAS